MKKFFGMTSKFRDSNEPYSPLDPKRVLERLDGISDEQIDLGMVALAISALSHEGIALGRYIHHLQILGDEITAYYKNLCDNGAPDDVHTRLEALKEILRDRYSYRGDRETYDHLDNSSLIRVIDRAKGIPISLCILYMHGARMQGWEISGLNIPGHFLCRLEAGGERIVFDPFEKARIVEAQDMREIVKETLGPQAELAAEYFEPMSNRDILIRLQNNIKFRQIEMEDYAGALETVQRMRVIDPDEYKLLLDEGGLLARTDKPRAAIVSLAAYIDKAPSSRDRMEAELLLQQLNDQIQ